MGKPLSPPPLRATGAPASEDKANAVVSGTLAFQGDVSLPFSFYGPFNISIWGSLTATLDTIAGLRTANVTGLTRSISSGGGVNVSSTLVPAGTTIRTPLSSIQITGITTVSLGGLTTAQVAGIATGSDPAAVFSGLGISAEGTVVVERSFDAGVTWLAYNINETGTPMKFAMGATGIDNPISFSISEPEVQVAYRLHCTVYTSGTINYRVSTTSPAPAAWGDPSR